MSDVGLLSRLATPVLWVLAGAAAAAGLGGLVVAVFLGESGALLLAAIPGVALWILIIEINDRARLSREGNPGQGRRGLSP